MAEEKKKSFADMFKKPSVSQKNSNDDVAENPDSFINKFGIKKRERSSSQESAASAIKKVIKSRDYDSPNADSDKTESTEAGSNELKSNFAKKIERGRTDLVFLVRGKDRGREAWHYVYVDKAKKEMFLAAARSGSFDVADYGKVLFSGWGKDPPESIVQKIKEMFNIT